MMWVFEPQSYSLDLRPKGANEQGVVLVRRFGIKWQKNQDVPVKLKTRILFVVQELLW